MNIEKTGTLVGYDVDSGEKLFTHTNRPVKLNNGTSSLPSAGALFVDSNKQYRVIGVRLGSTESLYEIDLREESSN